MSEEVTEEVLWQRAIDGDPASRTRIAELADRYSRLLSLLLGGVRERLRRAWLRRGRFRAGQPNS